MNMKTIDKHYYNPSICAVDISVSLNIMARKSGSFAGFKPKTLVNAFNGLAVCRKTKQAGMTRQRHPALTNTQRNCVMAKGFFITNSDGRKVYQRTGANRSWDCMKQRCTNPKHRAYKDYGGRGITICDSWMKFDNFLRDMGERPEGMTLDRIDNSKGYCKENCRWATGYEQGWNKRGHSDSNGGIKGVCFNNSTQRWQASARYMGKRYYLYHGPSKRAATKARRTFDNLVKHGATP